jgi:hypothetical protein
MALQQLLSALAHHPDQLLRRGVVWCIVVWKEGGWGVV